jgi:hypothetical protein
VPCHPTAGSCIRNYRVFNRPLQSLQARLSWTPPFIAGDARFTTTSINAFPIVTYGEGTVYFDPSTLPVSDAPVSAELRIPVADETLPGATPLDTLRITLLARRAGGVSVWTPRRSRCGSRRRRPTRCARARRRFAFDLPHDAPVSLAVYDASGRVVSTLAQGHWPAGRHQVTWSARRADGGVLPAGLYFARFSTPGLARIARLVILP